MAKTPNILINKWAKILVRRRKDTHKGDYGHVLIVGGSRGLTGAACLAALSCLRMGAGLVTAGVPGDLNHIFEIKLTETITLALPSQNGILSYESFGKIKEFISKRKVNVLALGPGLSNTEATQRLVKKIIEEIELPVLLDADGINAISPASDSLRRARSKIVITPHLGEFSRLLKKSADYIKNNRKELAKDFSLRYNLVLVLKGQNSLITDGRMLFENNTGNPGLATAGSGDVLAGLISGLLAQVLGKGSSNSVRIYDLFEAAKLGVYLHGLAADLAVKDRTQASLIASDIIEYLPRAIKTLLK